MERIILLDKLNFKQNCYSQVYIFMVTCTYLQVELQQLLEQEQAGEREKLVIFKNCVPFTEWITEINNTQIDNAKDIDFVIPMYDLTEYSDNH